eukprot:1148873-Pelagomonas_calceolata.AAC.6
MLHWYGHKLANHARQHTGRHDIPPSPTAPCCHPAGYNAPLTWPQTGHPRLPTHTGCVPWRHQASPQGRLLHRATPATQNGVGQSGRAPLCSTCPLFGEADEAQEQHAQPAGHAVLRGLSYMVPRADARLGACLQAQALTEPQLRISGVVLNSRGHEHRRVGKNVTGPCRTRRGVLQGAQGCCKAGGAPRYGHPWHAPNTDSIPSSLAYEHSAMCTVVVHSDLHRQRPNSLAY